MAERKKRGEAAMGGKKKSKSSKSKSKKKSDRKVKRIHLSRADSGELLAEHEHEPGADGQSFPNAQHVVPDGGMDDHLAEHLPPQPQPSVPSPSAGPLMGGGGM